MALRTCSAGSVLLIPPTRDLALCPRHAGRRTWNENRKRLLKEETCRRRIQSICRMSRTMYSKTVIFGKQNILQVPTYAKEARLKLIRNCRSYQLVTSSDLLYLLLNLQSQSFSSIPQPFPPSMNDLPLLPQPLILLTADLSLSGRFLRQPHSL
jgi:hypothetical protein